MATVDVNSFNQEKECEFECERYSVRDNGAVLRHAPEGKRARANDNHWTFGKENKDNGYLHLASVRVHRIIATAFHGDPPDPKYVVDHIDSNRQNNRPENLRWLTRLENTLQYPVTRKKIEYLCGSIEAFLENPSILNDLQLEPNYTWMRAVTKEEAQNCKARMAVWANSEKKIYRPFYGFKDSRAFANRAHKPLQRWEVGFGREPGLELSRTHWCATYMFSPSYFPCCPDVFKSNQLEEYFQNIKLGNVFAHTEENEDHPECVFSLTVVDSVIQREKRAILVLCEKSSVRWMVVGIELDEKTKWFIHFNFGTYSCIEEARKALIDKRNVGSFYSEGYSNTYRESRV